MLAAGGYQIFKMKWKITKLYLDGKIYQKR